MLRRDRRAAVRPLHSRDLDTKDDGQVSDQGSIEARAEAFRDGFARLQSEVGKVIVGHREIVEQLIVTLLAGGNALLEGLPGLGKTEMVKALASSLSLRFTRIQFTPDLMPADIIGTHVVMEDEQGGRHFEFRRGPIFGQVVLTDEINRATPKTQAALLEAMQERSVTVGGETFRLEEPFFVLATQNPIEMEGTYPLPEAQLDRFFFKIDVGPPTVAEMVEIVQRTTGAERPRAAPVLDGPAILSMRELAREVPIPSHVLEYAARLCLATQPHADVAAEVARRYVRYGASPRGAQALILAGKIFALADGRYNVGFDDIRRAAVPALRHRIILNFEGEAEGIVSGALIEQLLEQVPEAGQQAAAALVD